MSNIVDNFVEEYIRETLEKNDGILSEMEIYAEENDVPIIHKEVSELLKVLLKIKKPKKILEIGCAIGYSSILFSKVLDGDVQIITTERNPIMLEKAVENIKSAGLEEKIKILVGNAEETLADIDEEFDFVFIDAAKGQYKLFFDLIINKVKVGGVIVSDNILYKGMIASDEYVVRRKKTIVKRMRDYLKYICSEEGLTTSLIPIGDGVAITYKDK